MGVSVKVGAMKRAENFLTSFWIMLTIANHEPTVGFCNGKSLKNHLVRAALPKSNKTGRS